MADIRIKDLTTTASSTASDDFIAVDGTTNGTRKLNAFSPTFGGNATVTGTLTVNGTGTNSIPNLSVTGIGGLNVSANFLTSANTLRFSDSAAGGQTWFMSPQLGDGVATNFAFYSNDGVTSTPLFRVSSAGVFRLPSTAASTTTSTGALVVGNGTSGGLGVGGAINAGGDIATAATMRSVGFHVPGNGAGRPASTDSYLASTATTQIPLYVSGYTGGGQSADILRVSFNSSSDWFSVKGNGQVSCFATTASTSTSSGALVVSGGVGVAGAIYAGGDLTVDKTEPTITFKRAANTNLNIVNFWTGVNADFGIGLRNTSDSDLHIYNYGTSNDALKIAKNDSLATFGGAVRTAAPSGGTAANWKLGTVATVSPTSPNRTIEVDIGGTIYYIHAKTTNN